jgi:hypothetical protein
MQQVQARTDRTLQEEKECIEQRFANIIGRIHQINSTLVITSLRQEMHDVHILSTF